jgi:hypothetical protein
MCLKKLNRLKQQCQTNDSISQRSPRKQKTPPRRMQARPRKSTHPVRIMNAAASIVDTDGEVGKLGGPAADGLAS